MMLERKLTEMGADPADLVTEVTVLNKDEEMGKEYHFLEQVEKHDNKPSSIGKLKFHLINIRITT